MPAIPLPPTRPIGEDDAKGAPTIVASIDQSVLPPQRTPVVRPNAPVLAGTDRV